MHISYVIPRPARFLLLVKAASLLQHFGAHSFEVGVDPVAFEAVDLVVCARQYADRPIQNKGASWPEQKDWIGTWRNEASARPIGFLQGSPLFASRQKKKKQKKPTLLREC
jgi:hypothetical protein